MVDASSRVRRVPNKTREFDTTQLHEGVHGRILHRDYSAHFFRWSFARRFINVKHDVLEIGCGEDKPLSKILTGGVAPHVNSYVGVDLNKLKPSNNQRLEFIGEFNFVARYKELLKKKPEGFDVIVHYEVIEHMSVEHGVAMLKACLTCLKPGGVMLMSTPCYDGLRHAANHIHEYKVPELKTTAEKAGFTVERRFGTFMDIRHIGKESTGAAKLDEAVKILKPALSEYFDNDAISNIFGCLYPDQSRNNLWICRKPLSAVKTGGRR